MEQDSRKKLEDMKQKYDRIPVPDAAKSRMSAGIDKARREKRRHTMRNITGRTAATAAAAFVAFAVLVNVSPAAASAMENVPVLGAIAKVVTFRSYEDNTGNYEAKIDVPNVTMDNKKEENVNKSIEEYADDLIAQYEAALAEDQAGEGHYAIDSTYDVVTDNEKYLSLRIRTTVTMASAAESVKIFTVDKETGNVVTLKDLLGNSQELLTAIGDNIKQQMKEQMEKDEGVMYFYGSGDESADEFTGLTGGESWYVNGTGELVIAFDEYEVAPGYMGAVEFTIPREVTGDFV